MRIPSGKTDIVIYFVALDIDLSTRVTGLSSFTVYRSRNGGTATIYTTPTVAELSSANMPGVYSLLIDEDTTIASTSDSEEYVVHITATGMAPVTRTIELYRSVSAATIVDEVWDEVLSGHLTAGTAGAALNGAGAAGDPWTTTLPGAYGAGTAGKIIGDNINATVSSRATQTSVDDLPTNAELATSQGTADDATLAAIAALVIPSAATIADAVWDEDATGHQTLGTFGQAIGDPVADTNTIYKAVVTDATAATVGLDVVAVQADTDNIQTRIPAALVSGRMDSSVGAMAANVITAAATAADFSTEINTGMATSAALATLQTSVDDLPTNAELATSQATADDATLAAIAALTIPSAATVADAVWDEVLSGHLTAGTAGAALNGAGSAGDPWTTSLPGAYGAGTAGKIIGDNINATVSSRATQTSVDTLTGYVDTEVAAILAAVDTEVAAIKAKTDSLTFTTALRVDSQVYGMQADTVTASAIATDAIGSAELAASAITEIQAGLATSASITTLTGYVDTEVAAILAAVDTEVGAIKAKTDSLTFTVANQADVNIRAVNSVAVDGTGTGIDPWGPV